MAVTINNFPSYIVPLTFPINLEVSNPTPPAGNYYINFHLYTTDGVTDTATGIKEKVYLNNNTNTAYIDLAPLIRSVYNTDDWSNNNDPFQTKSNIGTRIRVYYEEVTDGTASAEVLVTGPNDDSIYFLNAVHFIEELTDYFDYQIYGIGAAKKQLKKVTAAQFWDGYPIYTAAYPFTFGSNPLLNISRFDAGGSLLGVNQTAILDSAPNSVYWIQKTLTTSADTAYLEVKILNDSQDITDIIRFDKCNVPLKPIFIRWINELGSWESWVFGRSQSWEIDRDTGGTIDINNRYLTETTRRSEETEFSFQKTVNVSAVTNNDQHYKLLRSIITSRKIQYCYDLTTLKFVDVKLNSYVSVDTREGYRSIEFTLLFPSAYA